jgi:hypothetical protein
MGPMKINSIQNLITLRGDLYDAWENYEYGVDPNVSDVQNGMLHLNMLSCRTIIRSLHL